MLRGGRRRRHEQDHLRLLSNDHRRQGHRPRRLPRQGRAHRQRGVRVRAHTAVQEPRGAAREVRRAGPRRPRLPCARVRRPGARDRRADQGLLRDALRREVRHVLEGQGQGPRDRPAICVPHERRGQPGLFGRHQVELQQIPRRQGGASSAGSSRRSSRRARRCRARSRRRSAPRPRTSRRPARGRSTRRRPAPDTPWHAGAPRSRGRSRCASPDFAGACCARGATT